MHLEKDCGGIKWKDCSDEDEIRQVELVAGCKVADGGVYMNL